MRSDRRKSTKKKGRTVYWTLMGILLACIIIPSGILGGILISESKGLPDYKIGNTGDLSNFNPSFLQTMKDDSQDEDAQEAEVPESNTEKEEAEKEEAEKEKEKEEEKEKEKKYKRSVSASSTLPDDGGVNYVARNLYDGNLSTAWSEGVFGPGVEEWITVSFDELIPEAIKIYNGYQKSETLYYSNCRICDAEIQFSNGKKYAITLMEDYGTGQVVYFPDLGEANSFKLTIKTIYEGSQWDDTNISEIEIFNPEEQDMYSEILIYAVEI